MHVRRITLTTAVLIIGEGITNATPRYIDFMYSRVCAGNSLT